MGEKWSKITILSVNFLLNGRTTVFQFFLRTCYYNVSSKRPISNKKYQLLPKLGRFESLACKRCTHNTVWFWNKLAFTEKGTATKTKPINDHFIKNCLLNFSNVIFSLRKNFSEQRYVNSDNVKVSFDIFAISLLEIV